MKTIRYIAIALTIISLAVGIGCSENSRQSETGILMEWGKYPHVVRDGSKFYMTSQYLGVDTIAIWASDNIVDLPNAPRKVLLTTTESGLRDIYSPEIHRITDRWYVYFEADDGNTDNHQLYVLENPNPDPMEGEWTLHGPIITSEVTNFGIHPTTIEVNGRQYLLWSGWQEQRKENETQCIFIAEMENPWTLKSERQLISMPKYEWERQWINPDGTRAAYPIFVNENPEAYLSADGKKVIVNYSASGIWTVYSTLGMLTADVGSDLLDPHNWTKSDEPLFRGDKDWPIFGVSNITVVNDKRQGEIDQWKVIYHAKHHAEDGAIIDDIRYKPLLWGEDSNPIFPLP